MTSYLTPVAAAVLAACSGFAAAENAGAADPKTMDTVTISAGRPTSLPTRIPTTIEGIDAARIEQTINATDSEDALKYLPSLLVRKRFIGDYNHAVLSTRASGTGNSARSMVFADGILLSNYLGNGAGFTPRWGLVTPEEIERVDVLYGPFSAAYPGNSAGAVVDYVTRMPDRFEAHAKFGYASQKFDLYSTGERNTGRQLSASVGSRAGKLAWWVNLNRLQSRGQPLVFANRAVSEGVAPAAGTPVVSGALAGRNNKGQDWWIIGTASSVDTAQEHAKLKLAYDLTPKLRASYTLGWWDNGAASAASSYLRDAAGRPVQSGRVLIGARQYNLDAPSPAFAPSVNTLTHLMQGLSLKTHTHGVFDWELAAGSYDYRRDILRAPTTLSGSAGRITDLQGTGWHNLNLRATWRPMGAARGPGAHVVELGYQQDAYQLRSLVSSTPDWRGAAPGPRFSSFQGDTTLKSLFAQDTWTISQRFKSTLGLRAERWNAFNGALGNAAVVVPFGVERGETHFSPKAALSMAAGGDWVLKASAGRSVRMPTVGELFQGAIVGSDIANSDPGLRPERSWTGELSAERNAERGSLRATLFVERTRDALYAQALPLAPTVSTVQNVDAIDTRGVEVAWQAANLWLPGFGLSSSATFTDSVIARNANFPASVGKLQPRVPRWRATAVATYAAGERVSYALAARYSGRQFGQLDNSDTNGFSYLGFSKFFVADLRVRVRLDRQWSAAAGIDNVNNYKYWAFHPYTQRTLVGELRFDL